MFVADLNGVVGVVDEFRSLVMKEVSEMSLDEAHRLLRQIRKLILQCLETFCESVRRHLGQGFLKKVVHFSLVQ